MDPKKSAGRSTAANLLGFLRTEGLRSIFLRGLQALGVYRQLDVVVGPTPTGDYQATVPVSGEILDESGIDEYLQLRPDQDHALIEARFAAGDLCFVGRVNGALASASWTARERAWIDYLECEILLGGGLAYAYDSYVEPEFRGKGVLGPGIRLRAETLKASGHDRVIGLLWPQNPAAWHRSSRRGDERIGRVRRYRIGPWTRVVLKLCESGGQGEPLVRLGTSERL
ncbi:MAG: hypothetical protein HKP19_04965 [Xanthomonadales bacterium]|nr:hypothetical protein [Xanthomonadales bacterium]